MSSEKAVLIRASVNAKKDQITQIIGDIMPEQVDQLEEELARIMTTILSTHFAQGPKYGHLAMIIPKAEYQTVINNVNWSYVEPAQRAQMEARHTWKNEEFQVFCSAMEGAKDLILFAVGSNALAPLKEKYVGFGNQNVHKMLKHLRDKPAIKMLDQEKEEFKSKGYGKLWDPSVNPDTFFKELEEFSTILNKREITTTEAERTLVVVARIQATGYFPSKIIMEWEKKKTNDKTWDNAKTHFLEAWQDQCIFERINSGGSVFKDHANQMRQMDTEQPVEPEKPPKEEPSVVELMMLALHKAHQDQVSQL